MSIYDNFVPTYLYIKQHSITGMLYFGKTVQNVNKYLGSGTYWMSHIAKHGEQHVITLWCELFTDKDAMTSFAIKFSNEMDIVNSKSWANLEYEDGVMGRAPGHEVTIETRSKLRLAKLGQRLSIDHRRKIGLGQIGMSKRGMSEVARENIRQSKIGKPTRKCSCIGCHRELASANINSHHRKCQRTLVK